LPRSTKCWASTEETTAEADGSAGSAKKKHESTPTIGGLRIGKHLPERRLDEPYDPVLEWEGDGQYYYLTKWMLALCRVFQVTGDVK